MKAGSPSAVIFTIALLGVLSFLTACATTGSERATETTNSMQAVEGNYKQASVQIDTTNAWLEDLIKPGQADMKKAYNGYAGSVEKMEKLGKQLEMHTEQMRTRGKEYFAEWEGTYTNPEIRELSERRRVETRELYAKIPEASIGVLGALKSYLTDIGEIRLYLSNDLTPQGIETIRPIARRAVRNGDNLRETIRPVLTAIDRVKAGMVQGGKNE